MRVFGVRLLLLKVSRVAQALLLVSCASISFAQGLDLDDPEVAKTIRSQYVYSPLLPDGSAFYNTLLMLNAMHSEIPKTADAWIQSEMGLDGEASQEFLWLMLDTLDSLDTNIKNFTQQTLCEAGIPKAVGDEIYPLFESIDDAREDLASDSLRIMRGQIDTDLGARLQQWLDKRKLNIAQVNFDYKKMYERKGASVDARLAAICNQLTRATGGNNK